MGLPNLELGKIKNLPIGSFQFKGFTDQLDEVFDRVDYSHDIASLWLDIHKKNVGCKLFLDLI